MTNEKIIDGVKYIPTKHAAEITAYAADYIGQLCRGGKIDCKRIGRSWFVSEEAILNYTKPVEASTAPKVRKTRTKKAVTASAEITQKPEESEQPSDLPELPSVEVSPMLEIKPTLVPEVIEKKQRQVSPFVTQLDAEINAEIPASENPEKHQPIEPIEPLVPEIVAEVTQVEKPYRHDHIKKDESKIHIHKHHDAHHAHNGKRVRITDIPVSAKEEKDETNDEAAIPLSQVAIDEESAPHAIEFPDASSFDKFKIYGTHGVGLAVVMVLFVFSLVTIVSKKPAVTDPDGLFTYDNVLDATANVSDSVNNLSDSVTHLFERIGEAEYAAVSSLFMSEESPEQNMAAVIVPVQEHRSDDISGAADQIIQTYK